MTENYIVIHTIFWKFSKLRLTSPSGPIRYSILSNFDHICRPRLYEMTINSGISAGLLVKIETNFTGNNSSCSPVQPGSTWVSDQSVHLARWMSALE